jgi:uncharacterized protein (DUF362 family)
VTHRRPPASGRPPPAGRSRVRERNDRLPQYTRKDFLKLAGAAVAGSTVAGSAVLAACGGRAVQSPPASLAQRSSPPPAVAGSAYVAVVHGPDPAAITRAAVEAVGGMKRFVARGADVIVKPNICTDGRAPEYAATTNPVVVATLVALALQAGAKRVRVMDQPFGGTAESAYQTSGIGAAVAAAGGEMVVMSPLGFDHVAIPKGRSITSWDVYRDVLTADTVIDVPIAKTHGSAGLTLGCKNLMGIVRGPGGFHSDLSQRIADLVSLVRPQLTIVDAVRILTANGPSGGDLADVRITDTVIASHDVVAADARATALFGLTARDVPAIAATAAMGLGKMNVPARQIRTIRL